MQTEKVVDHIINWMKDYATKANMNGFVIGISGGIDSAVTSALCAKTGMRTLCLEMPIHQHPDHVTRAHRHVEALQDNFANVTNLEVDLTPVFENFKDALPEAEPSDTLNLSLANSRARLRMTTLYYFAGLHRYLVAGTGNKVEDFGVGFFTKYGDGGVDLSPIADLLKSEVYEIGKYLNISEEILNAPPTDGLFGDTRTDEVQLGATYDELEWAMEMYASGKTELDFNGREEKALRIYRRLHNANQHKMTPIPVCEIPVYLKN